MSRDIHRQQRQRQRQRIVGESLQLTGLLSLVDHFERAASAGVPLPFFLALWRSAVGQLWVRAASLRELEHSPPGSHAELVLCMVLLLLLWDKLFAVTIGIGLLHGDPLASFLGRMNEFRENHATPREQAGDTAHAASLTAIRLGTACYRCTAAERGQTCAVCLNPCTLRHNVRKISRCGHFFHRRCIDQWFCSSSVCPVCRGELPDGDLQA